MTRVVAVGAVSGLGLGRDAYEVGEAGARACTVLRDDEELARAGLTRARCARAPLEDRHADRATTLLHEALQQVTSALDECWPGWRAKRIGLCVGTSSGGMISAERFFTELALGRAPSAKQASAATYFAPFEDAWRDSDLPAPVKRTQVVAACASSTIAIGLGTRWLRRGACDLVLAGGYDGVGTFVAAGFESLRATSASLPRPFCLERDGMLLGEGAALVALTQDAGVAPHFFITGFGASADAVHITAPDREGGGLTRAGARALADAGCAPERIDLVSAHGTATPYNDAAEAKAIAALSLEGAVVHPFKSQIGHTLGAAGVLELLAAGQALERQIAPAAYAEGERDPDARVSLLDRNEVRALDAALKLSSAFGGVTASLVVEGHERQPPPARATRPVHLAAHARVTGYDRERLAGDTGIARDRLARIDELGQLALAAVAALVRETGRDRLAGAGVVAGYALATLDTNARFHRRLHDKGPRWVDPRLFPATSPNAGAGHIAIAFNLVGPNFAVNRGMDGAFEALMAAAELVAHGDVERMLVVTADDDDDASRAWYEVTDSAGVRHARGALALLLEPGEGKHLVELDAEPPSEAAGHLLLADWIERATSS